MAMMAGTTVTRPLLEERRQWVGGGGAQGLPTPTPQPCHHRGPAVPSLSTPPPPLTGLALAELLARQPEHSGRGHGKCSQTTRSPQVPPAQESKPHLAKLPARAWEGNSHRVATHTAFKGGPHIPLHCRSRWEGMPLPSNHLPSSKR